MQSPYSNCITDVVTEMPRSRSMAIQSEVAWRRDLRAFTVPARAMALPSSSSFSVTVVLPASGWETIAKVRRRATAPASASEASAGTRFEAAMDEAGSSRAPHRNAKLPERRRHRRPADADAVVVQ